MSCEDSNKVIEDEDLNKVIEGEVSEEKLPFLFGVENDSIKVSSLEIEVSSFGPKTGELDVDGDANVDFIFHADGMIRPSGIDEGELTIEVLNPTFDFCVEEIYDTLYTYKSYFSNMEYDSVIVYSTLNALSGRHKEGGELIFIKPVSFDCPVIYSYGDSLTNDERWLSHEVALSSWSFVSQEIYLSNHSYYINRKIWEREELKYILFRKHFYNRVLYGWIKISVGWGDYCEIHEYAIEKAY